MSKYIDSFADAGISNGSMTDTMTMPQGAVGTKKKVKIDASLLNLESISSFVVGMNADFYKGETNEKGCVGSDAQTCTGKNCAGCR